MSMQTARAAAPQPVEKSAAVARRQAGANGDATESGAPTFASVLTSVEPEPDADTSAAAAANDAARGAAPPAPVPVPLDAAALLAQNPNRTAQLADPGAALLADLPERASAPGETAALSGLDGQTDGPAVGGLASHRLGHMCGKAQVASGLAKAAGVAAATDLAANTGTAQSVAAQHASNTQALLRRADVDRVTQEAGSQSLGKGSQWQGNEARLAADATSADGRISLAAQAVALPGSVTLDALGVSRMAVNPRGDRPATRTPFVPAGSALAGSWSDPAMPSGNPAALTTYAPDATVAVPEAVVAEKLSYWISRGVQNAELQLDAFGGGTVKVSISVQGQDAQVEFRSDQPEARKLLQDAMPQLSAMLQSEGLLLSGGFVGSSAQQDAGAQQRRSSPQGVRSAIIGVDIQAADQTLTLSRTPGRAVDLFV